MRILILLIFLAGCEQYETVRRKYGAGEREKMKQVTCERLNEGRPAPVLPVRWRLGDSPRERRVGDGL